jgi:CBS domain-containing protein
VNLAFFLTPVARVVWLPIHVPVAQAVETMRIHRYTAVPLLDGQGRYAGALTEGDLLFHLADAQSRPPDSVGAGDGGKARLSDVPRRREYRAVQVDTDIRELLTVAADQNFVPVVDSRGVLMGIVTRKAILAECAQLLGDNGLLPLGGKVM